MDNVEKQYLEFLKARIKSARDSAVATITGECLVVANERFIERDDPFESKWMFQIATADDEVEHPVEVRLDEYGELGFFSGFHVDEPTGLEPVNLYRALFNIQVPLTIYLMH